MIASQFTLDHRLAELREAGEDLRIAQACAAATKPDGSAVRSLIGWVRARFGASVASRSAGLATR